MVRTEQMETGQTSLLATFFVRKALCALDAAGVQEVICLGPLTRVRHAPPEILGVINLRGRIVTILDLGLRLGFDGAVIGKESRVFVIEDRNEFIGLLVDRIGEAIEVKAGNLEPAPANLSPAQSRSFQGVHRVGTEVIALLNLDQILTGGTE